MATAFEAAAYLDMIAKRAADAAESVAVAMAEAFKDHVTTVTLKRDAHDRLSKTPSAPGSPPAMVSGHLAGSFVVVPEGGGGGVGRAAAGPTAIYAAVQEFGATIHVRNRKALMWRTSYITDATNLEKSFREGAGTWLNFAPLVRIPARDYMKEGLREVVASGELERRKIAVFMGLVWR